MDAEDGAAAAAAASAVGSGAPSQAAEIAATLAQGSAEEREAACAAIEGTVRAALPSGSAKAHAIALAVACARPLSEVLCQPSSEVGRAEWLRVALLLFEMQKLDLLAVTAELWRRDDTGALAIFKMWTAPDTALASMVAKDPDSWTRDDAILAAVSSVLWSPIIAVGTTTVLEAAGTDELEYLGEFMGKCPFVGDNPQPADRFLPLALLVLDLVRTETDTQPEGVIAGAGITMYFTCFARPALCKALFDAGFLDVFQRTMQRYNPLERIGRQNLIPHGMMCALKDVVDGTQLQGVDVAQPLLDVGALDMSIANLTGYMLLGQENTSVCSLCWGGLYTLEILLDGSQAAAALLVDKLRSAGVDSFRFLMDNPLVQIGDIGLETGAIATRIAAQVWGRCDDGGGLRFKRQDVEKIVEAAGHRGPCAGFYPMRDSHGCSIACLCVSDINKELLLSCMDLIPMLVDSLLLDPEHPRQENTTLLGKTDWEAAKGPVQADFSEAIAQLAVYGPGRAALLQDPSVSEALQQVAAEGWTQESRMSAASALVALADRQPADVEGGHRGGHNAQQQLHQQRHIMLSYQWSYQSTVKRVVTELQARGYVTWFDLQNMKGSTVDAMSDAVDNAEVMLSCISLSYKESANCRLEAQYGHQQGVEMIPLMMEKDFKPIGWLGLLLGTRLYFSFDDAAIATDAAFMQQVDLVQRELGERGKGKGQGQGGTAEAAAARVAPEGVPPTLRSVQPTPAPTPAPAPVPAPAPRAAGAPAPSPVAMTVSTPERTTSSSFTPSMQQQRQPQQQQPASSSPSAVATMAQRSAMMTGDMAPAQSLVEVGGVLHVLLEREDKLRSQAKAEKDALEQKLETKMEAMALQMEKMHESRAAAAPPVEAEDAITERQLSALQVRVEALHTAKLLSDEEVYAVEDAVADFCEIKASMRVVTAEAVHTIEEARRLAKLVALSEGVSADGAFARQVRRKFCAQ